MPTSTKVTNGTTSTVTDSDLPPAGKGQTSTSDSAEEYVARQAYEEVTTDMHKYKAQAKAERAKAIELESRMKASDDERMKEQQKWKELYEREKQDRETMEAQRKVDRETFLQNTKLSALKTELGGKIKDAYLVHAALNEIESNEDGSLSPESIRTVANKFRQEHPSLIPPATTNQITNQAPGQGPAPVVTKPLSQMSYEEKIAALESSKPNRR